MMDFGNTIIIPVERDLPLLWEISKDFVIPVVFPIATYFLGLHVSDRKESRKFKEKIDIAKIDVIYELEYLITISQKTRHSLLVFSREERKKYTSAANQLKLLEVDLGDLKKIPKNDLTYILCKANGDSAISNRKKILDLFRAIKRFEYSISNAFKSHSEFNSELERSITEYNGKLTKLFSDINRIPTNNRFLFNCIERIDSILALWNTLNDNTNIFIIEERLINPIMSVTQSFTSQDSVIAEIFTTCYSILESINKTLEIKKFHTKSYRNYANNLKQVTVIAEPLLHEFKL